MYIIGIIAYPVEASSVFFTSLSSSSFFFRCSEWECSLFRCLSLWWWWWWPDRWWCLSLSLDDDLWWWWWWWDFVLSVIWALEGVTVGVLPLLGVLPVDESGVFCKLPSAPPHFKWSWRVLWRFLASTRLYEIVHIQQSIRPSTCHHKKSIKANTVGKNLQTFFLLLSLRSKAHCCLHCSHCRGAPYFFSEFVQRWHLLPINAAMMLQYSQADGWREKAPLHHWMLNPIVFKRLTFP